MTQLICHRREALPTIIGLACALIALLAVSLPAQTTADGKAKAPRRSDSTGVAAVAPRVMVDWAQFMARHDLVWKAVPATWDDAVFLGNGLLGAIIYTGEGNELVWDIGRSDVTDHRQGANPLLSKARMPIGRMILQTAGRIEGGSARLDLWNAEARGSVRTNLGEIHWRSFVHTDQMVVVVVLEATGGERRCHWQWRPALAINARKVFRKFPIDGDDLNPAPWVEEVGGARVSVQRLQYGGEYSTAWLEQGQADGTRVLYLSVGNSMAATQARDEALQAVGHGQEEGVERLAESHRAWWHGYYPASFLSIPDTRLESFYWIQMYKLASVTRPDRSAIDNMGPWFGAPTPWPGIWWNLDIEIDYSPVYAANRLNMGESLTRLLDRNLASLIQNVPKQFQYDSAGIGIASSLDARVDVEGDPTTKPGFRTLGNLLWVCHNYWLQYRYAMDEPMLRDRLYPLLKRAVNHYRHLLTPESDGKLHVPKAWSPEYPPPTTDTNYDLALLRWGCQTLLQAAQRLRIEDPLIPRWQAVLANLTPYPIDASGLMIGSGVPLAVSHRHFSHLLGIYPLRIINDEQPRMRELIERSLNHWAGMRQDWAGYSEAGASGIASSLGHGNEAHQFLVNLLNFYIMPNTMVREEGPVMQSSFLGATATQELLLQSWNGIIRVFPAVPAAWPDAVFHHLRADGAFLVSAVRRGGATQFVTVTSLAGEPCQVQTDLKGPLQILADREIQPQVLTGGVVQLDLRKGESATLYAAGASPAFTIDPVAGEPGRTNYFGSAALSDRTSTPYRGVSRPRIGKRPGDPEPTHSLDSSGKRPGEP